MSSGGKRYPISIGEFAVPSPRVGSIDAHSGYGRAMQEGIAIHQRVQKQRQEAYETYEPEVPIARVFEREGYSFEVSGRIDGLYRREQPWIEEIKTSFSVWELKTRLKSEPFHPYRLQLLTYGYFYYLEHGVVPELSFHLVSTRRSETEDLTIELDLDEYEEWMERRLEELVQDAKRAEKRAARRKKAAAEFAFPFTQPRSGQVELVETIENGLLAGERLLVQAPTGLGKTVGVLYPSMKDALARGQKVVYVTPKNSQHSVAEDAIERFQETGATVKSLTITAKSKICMKEEPLCNPQYCEYARGHYTKMAENGLLEKLARKKKLTAKAFRAMAEEFEVCPFELQLDAALEADAVICDYNYVFSPRSAFGRVAMTGFAQEGKPNLVIDEAHNLPARAMDYFSPALSTATLEKMREPLREIHSHFRADAETLLDRCIQILIDCRPDGPAGPRVIEPPAGPFLDQDSELKDLLRRYLDFDLEIEAGDPVLRLCFYWAEFTSNLEALALGEGGDEFFVTFQPHPTGGTVKITCCDASAMLKPCYDEYERVVAFSATLKPFEFYSRLSGLEGDRLRTAEFRSPFPSSNRKVLLIPQVSTKYSERERSTPRIAEAIARIAAVRPGNYFAFFPSFEFMDRVADACVPPPGFTVIRQLRNSKLAEVEAVIEHLKSGAAPTIVFAVQGGVFSEGVDYPGETIIGAFIVGPPLPSFDLEREEMRKYYDGKYTRGFDYAYAYPAMAKAVQSAGRVIRSETDRGLIVLMDRRFLDPSYVQSMPSDWFERSPRELVSEAILNDVKRFWSEGRSTQ